MGSIDEFIDSLDPIIAVVGFVSSVAKIFKKNAEFKAIMNELFAIQAQIEFL